MNKQNFDNIKMHGMRVKKNARYVCGKKKEKEKKVEMSIYTGDLVGRAS